MNTSLENKCSENEHINTQWTEVIIIYPFMAEVATEKY